MKICKSCGSTYDDRVDFCFRDGTPLVARAEDVADAEGAAGADASATSVPEAEPSQPAAPDVPAVDEPGADDAAAAAEPAEPADATAPADEVTQVGHRGASGGRMFGRPSFDDMLAVPEPGFARRPQSALDAPAPGAAAPPAAPGSADASDGEDDEIPTLLGEPGAALAGPPERAGTELPDDPVSLPPPPIGPTEALAPPSALGPASPDGPVLSGLESDASSVEGAVGAVPPSDEALPPPVEIAGGPSTDAEVAAALGAETEEVDVPGGGDVFEDGASQSGDEDPFAAYDQPAEERRTVAGLGIGLLLVAGAGAVLAAGLLLVLFVLPRTGDDGANDATVEVATVTQPAQPEPVEAVVEEPPPVVDDAVADGGESADGGGSTESGSDDAVAGNQPAGATAADETSGPPAVRSSSASTPSTASTARTTASTSSSPSSSRATPSSTSTPSTSRASTSTTPSTARTTSSTTPSTTTPSTSTAVAPPTSTAASTPPSTAPVTTPSASGDASADGSGVWGAASTVASKGALSISTTPAGAMVYVDNLQVGRAPIKHEVPYGTHTVRVQLAGFKTDARTVPVQSVEMAVPFELRPLVVTGQVNIFGPRGATVYVDNSPVGNIPATANISEGVHTFRVITAEGAEFSEDRDIRFQVPGRPVAVTLNPR